MTQTPPPRLRRRDRPDRRFGYVGQPIELIEALERTGARDLTIVNNNAGNGNIGLASLLRAGHVRKVICSFPRQTTPGSSTSCTAPAASRLRSSRKARERLRSAGAGIGAFFCPTGVATGLTARREQRTIEGRVYVLEHPLRGDFALIKALQPDAAGNLVYRKTARNFNPVMATTATVTIAQVESVNAPGALDP
jgi:3-oxoadipate CoA-transferase alpha subunit